MIKRQAPQEQYKHQRTANIERINHGNVFGNNDWCTFYCGSCKKQVYGDAKECVECGAILQMPKEEDMYEFSDCYDERLESTDEEINYYEEVEELLAYEERKKLQQM